jgi:hypothetical protein
MTGPGAPGGIRTPGQELRRLLLCPTELRGPDGSPDPRAGEGNRTPTTSLEGWSSAFELHPLSGRSIACGVGLAGFEPATPCSQSRCAAKLRYSPRDATIVPRSVPRYGHAGAPGIGRLCHRSL